VQDYGTEMGIFEGDSLVYHKQIFNFFSSFSYAIQFITYVLAAFFVFYKRKAIFKSEIVKLLLLTFIGTFLLYLF